MPYTSIQFIGYSIDTAPRDNGNGSSTYLGNPDPQLDIQARCQLMARAISTARDNLPTTSPPTAPGTVLKVFMAPEFYLRGAVGAYQMDDVQTAIAGLQALVAGAEWDDWLFVFGTILGVSGPPVPNAVQEIYNFALVQQGGVANSGAKGARVVMKELKSPIDFISNYAFGGGLLLGEVNPLPPGAPPGPGQARQQISYDGAGIFDLMGVTFALDICLDHLAYRLVNSPQLPGEPQVQVQLIPSCGADIDPNGVVAAHGGYVFNVDGHNGSHAVLECVGPPGGIPRIGTYPVDDTDITIATVSPTADLAIDTLYRYGAGEVVIFGARALPAAQTVPGTVTPLPIWSASPDYRFAFELVYDANQDFVTIMCVIHARKVNFAGRRYFMPLDLHTKDNTGADVHIQMRQTAGGGFDNAIWCRIDVPGFDFEGNALQFNDSMAPHSPPRPPPETIW